MSTEEAGGTGSGHAGDHRNGQRGRRGLGCNHGQPAGRRARCRVVGVYIEIISRARCQPGHVRTGAAGRKGADQHGGTSIPLVNAVAGGRTDSLPRERGGAATGGGPLETLPQHRGRSRGRGNLRPGGGVRPSTIVGGDLERVGGSGRQSANAGRGGAGRIAVDQHGLSVFELVEVVPGFSGRGRPTDRHRTRAGGRGRYASRCRRRGRGGRRRGSASRGVASQIGDQQVGFGSAQTGRQIVAHRSRLVLGAADGDIGEIALSCIQCGDRLGGTVQGALAVEGPTLIGDRHERCPLGRAVWCRRQIPNHRRP